MKKTSRQLWTNKLSKIPSSSNVSSLSPDSSQYSEKIKNIPNFVAQPFKGVVFGIDPSLRGTGVAVIDFFNHHDPKLLFSKKITIPAKIDFIASLGEISLAIENILKDFPNITACSMEKTIFVQNYKVAQILGAARGAIIATVSRKNIPVYEYEPLRIKQAIVGTGRASKEQVAKTVTNILKISNTDMSLDETDAIAAALCFAWTNKN